MDVPESTNADMSGSGPQWRGGKKADGTRTALLKCSNGHIGSLSNHDIADDGRVTPSVVCPVEECEFHEMVRLIGWSG